VKFIMHHVIARRDFRIWLLVLVLLGEMLLSGCGPRENQAPPASGSPPKREDYPKLQTMLFELVVADKREQLAQQAQLDYQEGRVRIVIEAQGGEWIDDLKWAVTALEGQVETAVEHFLQASVPVPALLKLATHPHVAYIRAPVKPEKGS
jgi:hypothetical protein